MFLHLRRALAGNLQAITVTEREKRRLLAVGIADETIQRYAVWRRSMLLVVIGPTLLSAVLASVDTTTQLQGNLSQVGKVITELSTVILYALPLSALAAAGNWYRLRRSHRWLVAGWAVAFLPQFLIALCPMGWWFPAADSPEAQLERQISVAVLDVLKGLYFYCTLMPAVLALLPGVMRACLRLKTLLPASILPGWFLVAGAPFFLLIWLVALILLNHLAGNLLLVLGVLLWIGAPMIYVGSADLFVRPISVDDCKTIDRLRLLSAVTAVVAMLLLLAYVMTKTVVGLRVVGLEQETSLLWLWQNQGEGQIDFDALRARAASIFWIGDLNIYQMTVEYFGRSSFVTAVFADLLMRMNLSAWEHQKRCSGTQAATAYDATMATMERLFASARQSERPATDPEPPVS